MNVCIIAQHSSVVSIDATSSRHKAKAPVSPRFAEPPVPHSLCPSPLPVSLLLLLPPLPRCVSSSWRLKLSLVLPLRARTMLRLGQSAARITRGVAFVARNDALLPSSGQQQQGMSMLRALGGRQPPRVSNKGSEPAHGSRRTDGSGSEEQSGHSISTSCSNSYPSRRAFSFEVSAAHLASPKRLMSTAAGGGSNPPTGNAGAGGSAVGDVGPEALWEGAAAASTADQVR